MTGEVGKALREARLRRGIELDEVERSLKIRTRYLRAMEEEAWQLLPGAAYESGFLRAYATYLGLDGGALLREHERMREPPAEIAPRPEPPPGAAPALGSPRARPRRTVLAAIAVAMVLGVVVVLGLTGGSNDRGGQGAGGHRRAARAPSTTTTSTVPQAAKPASVAVRLTASGDVWTCLVDEHGRALINGLTLSAGEVRGPYRAAAFKLTLGNGEMEMEVSGKPVQIPRVAEPLGYEITPNGSRPLAPAARPTCT